MHRLISIAVVVAVAVAISATPAAAEHQIPFKASDRGTFVTSETGVPFVVFTEDRTVGYATHLGRYTLQASEFINLATLAVTGGSWTMTAANGDTLFGTYEGQAAPTSDPVVITYHVEGPILGGTGRFVGVDGFLVWDGIANLASGQLSDVVSGWISNGEAR